MSHAGGSPEGRTRKERGLQQLRSGVLHLLQQSVQCKKIPRTLASRGMNPQTRLWRRRLGHLSIFLELTGFDAKLYAGWKSC